MKTQTIITFMTYEVKKVFFYDIWSCLKTISTSLVIFPYLNELIVHLINIIRYSEHTVVFVGYRLNDYNIKLLHDISFCKDCLVTHYRSEYQQDKYLSCINDYSPKEIHRQNANHIGFLNPHLGIITEIRTTLSPY